jgi:hypothetical protein
MDARSRCGEAAFICTGVDLDDLETPDEEHTMRNLLPFIFILACPVMMIFTMRRMHGGGHGTSKAGHDMHMDHQMSHGAVGTADPQAPDERIAALEHELAQLRALQARQADNDRVRGS